MESNTPPQVIDPTILAQAVSMAVASMQTPPTPKRNPWDVLDGLKKTNRANEKAVREEAVAGLDVLKGDDLAQVTTDISNGVSEAREDINAENGYRLDDTAKAVLEQAEDDRRVYLNTEDGRQVVTGAVESASELIKFTTSRPVKSGDNAGKVRGSVSFYC